MMKKLLFLFIGLLMLQAAHAQKDTIWVYMKNTGETVSVKADADYYMMILPADTSSGRKLYPAKGYYADGKVKFNETMVQGNQSGHLVLDGVSTDFYPNGHKQSISNYDSGDPVGLETEFYPNGQLYNMGKNVKVGKFRLIECRDSTGKVLATNGNGNWVKYDESFKNILNEGIIADSLKDGEWQGFIKNKIIYADIYSKGEFVSGTYYDKSGKTHSIPNTDTPPEYNGGITEFYNFIGKRLIYPRIDTKNNVQGKVLVTFVVEADGTLTDIKAEREPSETLGAEAVRVVGLTSPWIPGFQNGIPVRVQFTVPISFNIGNE